MVPGGLGVGVGTGVAVGAAVGIGVGTRVGVGTAAGVGAGVGGTGGSIGTTSPCAPVPFTSSTTQYARPATAAVESPCWPSLSTYPLAQLEVTSSSVVALGHTRTWPWLASLTT